MPENALEGRFDYRLRFEPDSYQMSSEERTATVLKSVREQLGLELVPNRRTVDMLVLSRPEKATAATSQR